MSEPNITQLLNRWNHGERQALDQLASAVYGELRTVVARCLRRQSSNFTLQSTALVHEAYLRLAGRKCLGVRDRVHFFSVAAKVIRGIMVAHARSRRAAKRGGGHAVITMLEKIAAEQPRSVNLLQPDGALCELELLDEQQSSIVELRYFAGLSVEETAQCLQISPATVKRDWVIAKAWMHRKLA